MPRLNMVDRWRADDGPLIVVLRSPLVSTLVNLKEKSNLDKIKRRVKFGYYIINVFLYNVTAFI